MQDRLLQTLIHQTIEMDACARLGRGDQTAAHTIRLRRISRAAVPIAAAILLPLFLSPIAKDVAPRGSRQAETRAALVSVDYLAADAQAQSGTIHSCAETPAMALVLLRMWEVDCQCIAWKVHENADGSAWVQLLANEAFEFALESTGAPAVEQAVLLAVSDQAAPDETDADLLLACLNRTCPAVWPGEEPLANPSDVLPCLPSGVTLVRRSFVVD